MADPTPTIDDACTALAEVISSTVGLRCKGYIDDQVNPPEAQINERDYDPRMVFGKGDNYGPSVYPLTVTVFVGRENARAAQKAIRAYKETTGGQSIVAAVENGDNWSQTIDYAEVVNIGRPYIASFPAGDAGNVSYLAVDFDVDVCW